MNDRPANDEVIEALVREALLGDGRLSSQTIEVSVREAVVFLRGSVPSYRRKLLAVRLVGSVRECRDVVNELEVEPTEVVDDERIALSTRAALDLHADIDKHTITVAVRGGSVTLRGTASSEWERLLAEDIALAVRGVRRVLNLVLVDPEGRLEDQVLQARVQSALERALITDHAVIETAVDQGGIVLSGRVANLALKQLAHDLAQQYSPRLVRNDIVVADGS
jgi:osmotically-inducible protein OsmY